MLVKTTPTGFIPTEDQGFVAISIATPPGTSLDVTTRVMKQAEEHLKNLEAARLVTSISGFNYSHNHPVLPLPSCFACSNQMKKEAKQKISMPS